MRLWLCLLISSQWLTTEVKAEERIIAAGGSITEILYALGLGEQIVAVDSSSYFPHEATEKPQVGYFRRLSAEGVLSMNPTQLVGSNGAGPDEALQHISHTGVEVKVFSQEIYTLDSWRAFIHEVGAYFKLVDQAELIVQRVETKLNAVQSKSIEQQKTAVFLMDIGDRGLVAAGKNTVPDMLFKLAQINNMVDQFEGFKPYSSEVLIQTKPDLIVMPSHVVAKMGGVDTICNNRVIRMSMATENCGILVIDALLALGFGTRIGEAVEVLVAYGQ